MLLFSYYIEQFDTQTPQLTIRETVAFSAKMRLDESDPKVTPESIEAFVDQTLRMLELSAIQHYLVGSDLAGGLSFEQRKRLSIAVELASNPSIIFLGKCSESKECARRCIPVINVVCIYMSCIRARIYTLLS